MKTVLTMDDLHFEPDGRVWARVYHSYDKVRRCARRPYKQLMPGDYDGREDALAKMNEWWASMAPAARHGVPATLAGMLEAWLRASAKGWKPGGTTEADYRSKVELYVVPYLGDVQARDIDPPAIDDLYDALLASGGRARGGLSPNTVIIVHRILSKAYRWAVPRGLADYNPVDYVTKPRPAEHEAVALDASDVAALTAALDAELSAGAEGPRAIARRNRMFAAYLSLMTGLRLGEVCALTRRDVALGEPGGAVHVGGTVTERGGVRLVAAPKSASSRRTVPFSGEVADRIREHYGWQASYLKGAASRSGSYLCSASGFNPMRPSSVSAGFSRLRDGLGLPSGCTFHSLRHTFATWQLAAGTPLQEVSAMLGHSNEAITLRVYAHVLPGRGAESAAAYAESIRKAADAHAGD